MVGAEVVQDGEIVVAGSAGQEILHGVIVLLVVLDVLSGLAGLAR